MLLLCQRNAPLDGVTALLFPGLLLNVSTLVTAVPSRLFENMQEVYKITNLVNTESSKALANTHHMSLEVSIAGM